MHIESLGTYKSSFVLSVTPLSGESLSGLLARAAAYNVVYSPKDIFAMVGLPRGQLGSIATSCHLQISKIANVLGVDESVINQLFYKHGNEQPRRGEYISFCGMSLPVRAREGEFRRVSFHSLRNSPHHRASWELRFLPWCPESFEYLADVCPSCDTQLGWRKFDGVQDVSIVHLTYAHSTVISYLKIVEGTHIRFRAYFHLIGSNGQRKGPHCTMI